MNKEKLELSSTIIMALATVLSTWCSYQAAVWSGDELENRSASAAANTKAGKADIIANQRRMVDASLFLKYLEGLNSRNKEQMRFLRQRMNQSLILAIDAWLRTNPLENPEAPKTALEMPQYELEEEKQSDLYHNLSEKLKIKANALKAHADAYSRVTVALALIIFLSAMAPSAKLTFAQKTMLYVAGGLFCAIIIKTLTLPIGI